MDQGDFEKLVALDPVLSPYRGFLRGLLKPCVRIKMVDQRPRGTQSQFGGIPMLPPGFAWPRRDVGIYRFLGQINLAEIVGRPESLPASGLLVLFYAEYDPGSDDEEEEIF